MSEPLESLSFVEEIEIDLGQSWIHMTAGIQIPAGAQLSLAGFLIGV
jgi:hypothetical protein